MADTTNGTTQAFTWDENSSVPKVLFDSTNFYLYGPGGTPIEQVSASQGTESYLYTDQLGSVVMAADQSGKVTGTQSFTAYGTLASQSGQITTPFGFAGGYSDATGLIYLVNRYYDPQSGQFVSVDPLVAVTGAAYGYSKQDPINSNDPLGLSTSSCLGNPLFPRNGRATNQWSEQSGGGGAMAIDQFIIYTAAIIDWVFAYITNPAPRYSPAEYIGNAVCNIINYIEFGGQGPGWLTGDNCSSSAASHNVLSVVQSVFVNAIHGVNQCLVIDVNSGGGPSGNALSISHINSVSAVGVGNGRGAGWGSCLYSTSNSQGP